MQQQLLGNERGQGRHAGKEGRPGMQARLRLAVSSVQVKEWGLCSEYYWGA